MQVEPGHARAEVTYRSDAARTLRIAPSMRNDYLRPAGDVQRTRESALEALQQAHARDRRGGIVARVLDDTGSAPRIGYQAMQLRDVSDLDPHGRFETGMNGRWAPRTATARSAAELDMIDGLGERVPVSQGTYPQPGRDLPADRWGTIVRNGEKTHIDPNRFHALGPVFSTPDEARSFAVAANAATGKPMLVTSDVRGLAVQALEGVPALEQGRAGAQELSFRPPTGRSGLLAVAADGTLLEANAAARRGIAVRNAAIGGAIIVGSGLGLLLIANGIDGAVPRPSWPEFMK